MSSWLPVGGTSPGEWTWPVIYIIIMTTLAQLLLLALIVVLAYKMNRLVAKLDRISQDAGKFVQMGMTFFKKR